MAQVNSINNATSQLTIDPGASGNSFVQYNVNASSKFIMGIDDSASDAFKVSVGSALGTTDSFIITSAGYNTMPLCPAFLGYLPSTDTNVTGDATVYTLGGTTALTKAFDLGTNFTTAGVFTAPITARYHFTAMVEANNMTSSNNLYYIQIVTTNRTYQINIDPASIIGSGILSNKVATVADMTSGDTAKVQISVANTTKVVGCVGGSNGNSSFSGFLAC
jgi:hypothetical protein